MRDVCVVFDRTIFRGMSDVAHTEEKMFIGRIPGNMFTCLPNPEPLPAPQCMPTLFQWQIEQERRRYEGVAPELLSLQDTDGDTWLHIAVAQGKRALAYMLASKMANSGALEIKEHNGQIAAAANQHLIVGDLLWHGANVNTRDSWGRSPLHVCSEKGFYLCLQSIQETFSACSHMIDTEVFNYDGLTPLHVAVLSHNAVENEWRRRAHTFTTDLCQYQYQYQKMKQIYVQCVETLLNMGASCTTKDLKSGRTCLHMAAEEANCQLLNIFLRQPSALNVVNDKTCGGNTALHIASSLQNNPSQLEAVIMLMMGGADPTVRNSENELPWQLAPGGPIGERVRQILGGKYVDV
ncbi:NF-kappa-B inhibitor zeta isoform X2 [Corythoichthys intestinalis]|uniref:NF-kappa-B inhibitor zeta isoform X2 n=1 Tax=Corythoichthys intestinalis TaxID=161448 RepID=UPI0025A595D0|nr:NF-kappa-B inhibitor zeta isoform X2 [Corythoichthys intestinalis]